MAGVLAVTWKFRHPTKSRLIARSRQRFTGGEGEFAACTKLTCSGVLINDRFCTPFSGSTGKPVNPFEGGEVVVPIRATGKANMRIGLYVDRAIE